MSTEVKISAGTDVSKLMLKHDSLGFKVTENPDNVAGLSEGTLVMSVRCDDRLASFEDVHLSGSNIGTLTRIGRFGAAMGKFSADVVLTLIHNPV